MWIKIKNFILDIIFPKFCLGCQKEGTYICLDCEALLDISNFHFPSSFDSLDDLYWACAYHNPLIKKLIHNFKYQPFVKELRKDLTVLILNHFQLLDYPPNFSDFVLIPVPLHLTRLKWRGYNQAAEIAKTLSQALNLPLLLNSLLKTKKTYSQSELSGAQRKENLKQAFYCPYPQEIKNKNILLVDDVFTTGTTLKECARTLKEAGVNKVIGIVITRG